ncbi:mediator complex, subunit Med20 [Tricharina praecox]|uniref:mediator complex, subunit Med20 n=1 Tax=Tricharina praecox TaxID=43433 RepID=UPI002220228A|nr:mediator complex, subunit Med20 [Tricharina praecox]KAI5849074.1 mediator complex, subunit Med20 [Tricharina praecox]
MPVTGLYFIAEQTSTSNSPPINITLLDRLQKRHQPIAAGGYRLDHRLLRSTAPSSGSSGSSGGPDGSSGGGPSPPAFLQYLEIPHLSPIPFALCGSAIVTIDRDFAQILKTKLSTLWTLRQTLRAEGHCYEVDDFRVRVGRVMGDQVRGVVVEVEYLPVDTMNAGEAVLKDFIEGLQLPFPGRWVLGTEKTKEWTVLDTGRLYCELLRFR